MPVSTLMVVLTAGADNDALLTFTARLAARLQVRRVVGIAACQPLQVIGDSAPYLPGDFYERDLAEIDRQLADAQARFRKLVTGPGLVLDWRSSVTSQLLSDAVAREARSNTQSSWNGFIVCLSPRTT